jgi:hypothetical protein|tara:strand:+ start:77 stop:319 length:243 start_codon:yes stop_codon:yes gene_type:complete
MTKNVNHDFNYHAEIIYETEEGFAFTNAMGNTMQELIDDINARFKQYEDRQPQLSEVIFEPNNEKIDITSKIRTILNKGE